MGEPLEILYEDSWLIAVNKPAGMLVHPGKTPEAADQIAMKVLRDQIGQRVSTIHRLDRPTSGVLIFAIDGQAEIEMRGLFAKHKLTKTYKAVVAGEVAESWIATEKLQKAEHEPFREAETQFARDRDCEIGGEKFSILNVVPRTGRFHQIRKHLALGGTPIVGDFLYGDVGFMDRIAAMINQPRLMLHAHRLEFRHPMTGDEVVVEAPLPKRFSPFGASAE